jgi:hypothetical protein
MYAEMVREALAALPGYGSEVNVEYVYRGDRYMPGLSRTYGSFVGSTRLTGIW